MPKTGGVFEAICFTIKGQRLKEESHIGGIVTNNEVGNQRRKNVENISEVMIEKEKDIRRKAENMANGNKYLMKGKHEQGRVCDQSTVNTLQPVI